MPGVSYGDLYRASEIEGSKYNFDEADVEQLKQEFALSEMESTRLIEKGLVRPAYDQCIKSSHCFNLLDARGVLSVAERTNHIARVRRLARIIAEGYLKQ